MRQVAGEYLVRRSEGEKVGRRTNDRTAHGRFPVGHDLAGVRRYAPGDSELSQLDRGAQAPYGVVLVRDGATEDAHHRPVWDSLHGGAVALKDLLRTLAESGHDVT
jgi:hypothetical protein